jgi:hypothetical protein
MIENLGGTFSNLEEADFVIVHLRKISLREIFKKKNVVNCKFITDSLLNMKIPHDNIERYKDFA